MGICHLSLITKTLDKLWLVHSFKRDNHHPPPPFSSFFHGKSQDQITKKPTLPCTISLEYSIAVKKTPEFPGILKSHQKSSLTPFLHRALQL